MNGASHARVVTNRPALACPSLLQDKLLKNYFWFLGNDNLHLWSLILARYAQSHGYHVSFRRFRCEQPKVGNQQGSSEGAVSASLLHHCYSDRQVGFKSEPCNTQL